MTGVETMTRSKVSVVLAVPSGLTAVMGASSCGRTVIVEGRDQLDLQCGTEVSVASGPKSRQPEIGR
jgi:hypothetical protein